MKNIKQLMNSFAKNSSPTVTKKLIALNKICQQQYDRGSRDFSVATIGKIAEEEGLMKVQTIRNTSGEKYYTLIEAWSDNNPSNKVTKKNELDWIDS
ncbi:MAG: gamma-mobile-trio protein GmtX, partial [Thalassotalea sp.]|nr:gamma-mobile-trio protein GmtX [Thalassotalea sp.]